MITDVIQHGSQGSSSLMKLQFNARKILAIVAIVAVALSLPSILRRIEFNRQLSIARAMTQEPDGFKMTAMCNRKLECENGDTYHLYFWSTNGGPGFSIRSNYMISVITLLDGQQYVKQEAFAYIRSRVIGDPPDKLTENIQWLGLETPANGYDFWDIHHASNQAELCDILIKHEFIRYD
eukprot:COSAG01_NODE_18272_length_1087_cov_1.682186_2_plen_180_part_00